LAATYDSQGKVAKFRIEFGPAKYSETKDPHGFRIGVGEGRILAETGSENSVLLADLKKALEAKEFPKKIQRVNSLPFTFANLGEKMSQAKGGGFNAAPLGNWTATKVFFGEGEEESEVFLNIDPVGQKGQFSIKDADYGDMVLAQLAKVL
jgi:hypothetical protein